MWKQVGERVEKLRIERNLTKAQFGQMIGLSGQYVGMIERGSGLSVDSIVNICQVLGVSADYVLFGKSSPLSAPVALKWLTNEQVWLVFDIIKRVVLLINTEDGNEALIQEVLRQQNTPLPT